MMTRVGVRFVWRNLICLAKSSNYILLALLPRVFLSHLKEPLSLTEATSVKRTVIYNVVLFNLAVEKTFWEVSLGVRMSYPSNYSNFQEYLLEKQWARKKVSGPLSLRPVCTAP